MSSIEWCAGFFDGEGTISQSSRGQWKVQLQQNSREPLEVLEFHLGGVIDGPMTRYRRINPHRSSNPYWLWRLRAREIRPALELLMPYLVVKRGRAAAYLERG